MAMRIFSPTSMKPLPVYGPEMTDALILRLATDLRPVSNHAVARRLSLGLASGGAASALLLLFALGLRPDLVDATSSGIFWLKLAYGAGLTAIGLALGDRLLRPAGEAGGRLGWLLLPISAVALASFWQLGHALPVERHQLVFGASASRCPLYVALFSLAPLAGLVWAVRGFAPTHLALAGAVIGLAAGGAGAVVYALHCGEPGAPFLGIWYSLGIAAVTVAGAVLGPKVLRW